jgi:hypothetical protein
MKNDIICVSDLHCGHKGGLTPPRYQEYVIQEKLWNWYRLQARRAGEIGVLVVDGDVIEGKGFRSGGTELITTDRNEQVKIACECLSVWNTKKIYMTYGTPYHTGRGEDWEDSVAREMGAVIEDNLLRTFNGVSFDIRHKVGSSSVPYGRATSISKSSVWNLLNSVTGLHDKADVIVRAHVHHRLYIDDFMGIRTTLPCLQLWSKFGSRQCEGHVDFGIVRFRVPNKHTMTYKPMLFMADELVRKAEGF